jgi:hypothetical protein
MLWNRKLQYRAHKSPCLVLIPSQRNRVTPSRTFLMVHYHIVLPSTPSFSSGPFLHFPTPEPWMYFLFSPVHATYPVHLIHISFHRHQRPTTCKCGSPDEDATDLFGVRLHETQRRLKQNAAVVKTGQSDGLWHHTPMAGSTPTTHDVSEYRHVWATRESLNVAMMPLLPLPRNDVRHDTHRQHFIQATTAIRDGMLR